MDDLENLGITELSQAYTGGATRPTQVAAQCLARIDKLEPQLGAFELVMADQVMEAAEVKSDLSRFRTISGVWRTLFLALTALGVVLSVNQIFNLKFFVEFETDNLVL